MSNSILLSGNEAIALGAWEAGVDIGVGYPGTPSTETLESLAKYAGVYTEWAPNEKVALEVAAGASFAGSRTLVTMKHVGLNVAADPLFTLAYTGVNGGLVILVADDPGMHSSQNEQDSHNYARFAGVCMLDPADAQEAYQMTKLAFEISEKYDIVVIVRSTVRVSHTKQMVEIGSRATGLRKEMEREPKKWVMMPAYSRPARIKRDENIKRLSLEAGDLSIALGKLNRAELRDKAYGIVCAGVVYHYVREAIEDASTFKIGMSYPLPIDEIKAFAKSVDELYVAEEADNYFERELLAAGIDVKPLLVPRRGELSPELIRKGMGLSSALDEANAPEEVVGRPPLLCAGCPHRSVYAALKKVRAVVTGDIGCYTLGVIPPLQGIDTCVCMGASIPMAHGVELSRLVEREEAQLKGEEPKRYKNPVIGIIGDSTFAHSGITGVLNTVYNGGTGTVLILDNRITAMTGQQGNPLNGITLQDRPSHEVDLPALLRGLGVKHVREVDPTDHSATIDALKEETGREEYSVIIFKSPCILLTRNWPLPYRVDPEICTGCKICTTLGCPAIGFDDEKSIAYIEKSACRGCDLCAQVCPFDAISQTKGEDNAD